MTEEQWLGKDNQLGIDIWNKKYRYNNETFDEWLDRVSGGDKDLRALILEKKFLFGGRILSNRGLDKQGEKVTLSNCYVIEPPEDNIESIFDCAKKLARTYSYGGGCGVDISKLAPKGAKVTNTAKETSGSVSFMDLYSLVTGLIGQNGRRGALMISIACDHPDLEEFIEIKSDLDKVTKANISVRITDKFMMAVKMRKPFVLSFTREETGETIRKEIDAYSVFHKLCEMNWDYAEPGMLFWDRIENWNLLSADKEFSYAGTNPCAEEPLPAGGSCLLGSINLSEFVTENKTFNFTDFKKTVDIAVRALNIVLDEGLPLHPLKEQRESVRDWRQIGLGIFGLADLLIKMEIKYGSPESIDLCDMIGHVMAYQAIMTSNSIAIEVGSYPKYKPDAVKQSPFFAEHIDELYRENISEIGLCNSQLLTIAPTGSLSSMLGVSGGIEPVYANYYTRKTESLHGHDEYYKENYMNTELTELVFVLDRSGSMGGLESDTIGGFNSMIMKQKSQGSKVNVTTILFDDEVDIIHDRFPVEIIQPLTEKEYFVRGCTALLDAVGTAIEKMENVQKYLPENYRAGKVIFVITTDGLENSSEHYTQEQIRQKIEARKEYGWEFLFLGANIDAGKEAEKMGISRNRSVTYENDSKGIELNFKAVGRAISKAVESNDLMDFMDDHWADEIQDYKEGKKI